MVVDSSKNIVEQCDAIESLKFYHSIVWIEIVTSPGSNGDLKDLLCLGFKKIFLLLEVFGRVVILLVVDFIKGCDNGLLSVVVGDRLEIVIADAEEV